MTDPLQTLWAAQSDTALAPDPAQVAQRSRHLHRRVMLRDLTEYVAATGVIGMFASFAWRSSDPLLWTGCALVIIGTLVMMANLWRLHPRDRPEAFAAPSGAFLREQLVRQRDALANVWRWYLAPVVPGLLVFLLATARQLGSELPPLVVAGLAAAAAGLVALVFYTIHRLNRAAARALDREIAALDNGLASPLSSQPGDHRHA